MSIQHAVLPLWYFENGKTSKETYNNIDEIIDYVMNNKSDDTESDIDLGESDYERRFVD